MRHGKKFNHLSRTASHRKAMLSNMAGSLIEHKRINTTLAKAKALRIYIEPIITKSKTDSTHSRRIAFKYLKSKYAVSELFRTIAPKVNDRPGGYTRIIKLGTRKGDNAEMAMIELVDFNELLMNTEEAPKKKARRSRRGGATAKTESTEKIQEAVVVEDEKTETPEAKEEPKADEGEKEETKED